jgi:hypothetical protein
MGRFNVVTNHELRGRVSKSAVQCHLAEGFSMRGQMPLNRLDQLLNVDRLSETWMSVDTEVGL